jgi:hypothetical protein
MKDPVTNRLNMIGACIAVAERPEYVPVWTNQLPQDFTTDFAALKTEYNATTAAAAVAYAATTGPADAKALAETALEDAAFVLARACVAHFTKTGDATRRAQVDFTKSAIVRLREQTLLSTATLIRDLADGARGETGAGARGVTQARVTALTNALNAFSAQLNAPRSQIANRAALIRDVETRVAGLVARAEEMDDLVVQFDGTAAARAFGAAWKQARLIVDAGHGPGEPPAPPPPNP